jgi:hypothetical protein
MTPPADRQRTERLLERIRTRVAELRRLEQTHTDQNELQQRRRDTRSGAVFGSIRFATDCHRLQPRGSF